MSDTTATRTTPIALTHDGFAELSGVHWVAGGHSAERQPTTIGWPTLFGERRVVTALEPLARYSSERTV